MSDDDIGPREIARYKAITAAAKGLEQWMVRPEIAIEGHQVPESLRPVLASIIAAYVHLPMLEKQATECHGLDTPERVRFYEHDFYPLSNFSAFPIRWPTADYGGSYDTPFPTSEHVYHWEKFRFGDGDGNSIARRIRTGDLSAHEAFKLAEVNREHRRKGWDDVKVDVMRRILRAKVEQHEYVKRKLLATGERLLVEDSWRDGFWGWGPDQTGQNILGKLWMEIRTELRATAQKTESGT